jgi:hypothetical protein
MITNPVNDIRQELVDIYNDEELLFADGFDDCIIGVSSGFDSAYKIVYDIGKIIDRLIADGMSSEEAEEYFDFNILGAYVGDRTPLYVNVYEK